MMHDCTMFGADNRYMWLGLKIDRVSSTVGAQLEGFM